MTTSTTRETRTAKDPEAYVRDLDAAGRSLGWGRRYFGASLIEVLPGETKSGRKRFVVEIADLGPMPS